MASLVTLGLPALLFGLRAADLEAAANLVPTGLSYTPVRDGVTGAWAVGLVLTGATAAVLTRRGLAHCEADLRLWYDRNQGRKSVE